MNKITKIEVQKKNKDRVNVYVDHQFTFACDSELVYRYNIKVEECMDIKSILTIVEEDNFIKCKNSALRIVEKAYKTEKEIIDKLTLKGFDSKCIEKTMGFLREYNFIDDKKFTDMFIKDKLKSQGKQKIKYTLLRKGVSEELIKDKISNINSDIEEEGAYKLCLKKYNQLIKRESDKYKISQKLYRFLASKGYDYQCISDTLKKIMNTSEFME